MSKTENHLFHPGLRLLIPTIVMVAVIAACGSRRNHTNLPAGFVDTPPLSGQAVLRGDTIFEGWALADDGVEETAVYLDRQYLTSARTGVERPDVAKSFPKGLTQVNRVGEPQLMFRICRQACTRLLFKRLRTAAQSRILDRFRPR